MGQRFYGPCAPSWTLEAEAGALPVTSACGPRARFPVLHHAQARARHLLRTEAVCMRAEACRRCWGYHLARLLPEHGAEAPPC